VADVIDLLELRIPAGKIRIGEEEYEVFGFDDIPLADILRFDQLTRDPTEENIVEALRIVVPDLPEDVAKRITKRQFEAIMRLIRGGGENFPPGAGEK